MKPALLAVVVVAPLLSLNACCGAGCPPRTTNGAAPSTSSSTTTAKLSPRLDLHCTPQTADGEGKCVAQGSDHHYGPPLVCRGVPVPDSVLEEERKAYEAGTNPCTCYTNEDIKRCSEVP